MNNALRQKSVSAGMPLMDYILKRIHELESQTGIKRTIFAACPNSVSVIRAALRSAKRCGSPIKFAATLNQVDLEGAYTGLNQFEFVKLIRLEARRINLTSPVIIAVDHGGPWLKDIHTREKWPLEKTMSAVRKSFEAAIEAGYDLIHVDPTVDITIPHGEYLSISTIAERTVGLIAHTENFRRSRGYNRVAYEVGTEEVHGGLADLDVFREFLDLLRTGLKREKLTDVWPCFVVGKVGTDLHTTYFDPATARQLTEIAGAYGSLIKGHYSDNVSNPEEYPASGMGAANVGPEFTENEYEGLMELEAIQKSLYNEGRIAKQSEIKKVLWSAVINSGRWKKWIQPGENRDDFYSLSPGRQEWLIKTGCRYIWESPEVVAARAKLCQNLEMNGLDAETIIELSIERAMERYFYRFNLVGLSSQL